MSTFSEKSLIEKIGAVIFSIRWTLVPMYVGLWIVMLAYDYQFFKEMFEFIFLKEHDGHNSTAYLLWILGLIDITMIGNLVVMTTVGGFSTFVKEYDFGTLKGMPRWMNGLDSSTLKIKMGMSLVGVSAIHLLKTFMEPHASWDEIGKEVLIHVVFIGTTLGFALNAKLLHSHHPAPSVDNPVINPHKD
jgi:uncharacterized protein (TIGR00645 family)